MACSAVEPLLRGIKVLCLRSNGKTSVPNSYYVSISAKIAAVAKFDAKSNLTPWAIVKKQPSG